MTELLRRLDPTRWEVHLACFEAKGPWFERAAEHAASVAEFPVRELRPSGRRSATSGTSRAGAASRRIAWCRRPRSTRTSSRCPAAALGRRAGAHRQPPRHQPGSDARPGRAAAPRLRLRARWSSRTRAPSADQLRLERVPERRDRRRAQRPRLRAVRAADSSRGAAQGRRRSRTAAAQGTRRADRCGGRDPGALSRRAVRDHRRGTRTRARSQRGPRRAASRTPSTSSGTATTSRRGSRTPTSSCSPRGPSHSRTRSSKRWRRACRSSPPASAASSS